MGGILTTQRVMGVSCLLFYLPAVVYVWQLSVNGSSISTCHKIGAGLMCLMWGYAGTISFLADYWYSGDDEFRENPAIPEHQKQYIFNAIDLATAPVASVVGISLLGYQYLYGNGYRGASPVLLVSFLAGVAIQQLSLKYLKCFTQIAYVEDYDVSNIHPEATKYIWWGLNLHSLWHLFAAISVLIQMYLLLTVGVSV